MKLIGQMICLVIVLVYLLLRFFIAMNNDDVVEMGVAGGVLMALVTFLQLVY